MSYAFSEVHGVTHAVALNRLQACRSDAAAPAPSASKADFADTAPLWFRSEAFAEDVTEAASGAAADHRGVGSSLLRGIDAQVIAAGAAVLHLTLQALQLQRRK